MFNWFRQVSDSGSLMEHFLTLSSTLSSTLHHHVDHVSLPTPLELPSKPSASHSPPVVKGTSVVDNVDYVPISGAFTAGKLFFDKPDPIEIVDDQEIDKRDFRTTTTF